MVGKIFHHEMNGAAQTTVAQVPSSNPLSLIPAVECCSASLRICLLENQGDEELYKEVLSTLYFLFCC